MRAERRAEKISVVLRVVLSSVLRVSTRHAVGLYLVRFVYVCVHRTVERGWNTLQLSGLPFNGAHPSVMREVVM
jgi:hypothetical protein